MDKDITHKQIRFLETLITLLLFVEFYQLVGGWGILVGGILIVFLRSLYFADHEAVFTAVFGGKP